MGIWGVDATSAMAARTINSVHTVAAEGGGGLGGGQGGGSGGRGVGRGGGRSGGRGGSGAYGTCGNGGSGGGSARLSAPALSRAQLATPGMLPRENTRDRSGLLLTAEDGGVVRLLRYPSLVAAAPAREGHAHCDRVACARFLCDAAGAVSVGLYDRIVVRWEVVGDAASVGTVIVSGVSQGARTAARPYS